MVISAGRSDTKTAQQALEELCCAYWYPLYAYVRRRGYSAEDAEDLTQEFFHQLLSGDSLKTADPGKGRFRSFLLTVLKRFLANEWDRARALKRGGGRLLLSLDTSEAETRFGIEPAVDAAPDRMFDRRWAMALLSRAMARVREEFAGAGKAEEFEHIKACLTAERGAIAYADIARTTGMSEGALRVAIHRLRKRFREIFRDEIAQTVSSTAEIDEEVRYLTSVLAE